MGMAFPSSECTVPALPLPVPPTVPVPRRNGALSPRDLPSEWKHIHARAAPSQEPCGSHAPRILEVVPCQAPNASLSRRPILGAPGLAIWLPSVQNKKSPRTVLFVGRFACVGVFLLSGSLEVKSFGQSEGACYFDRICQIPLRGRGPRTPPQQGPPRPLPHPCQLRVLSKAVVCQAVRCNWHLAVGLMCFSVIISKDGHRVVC